MTQNDPTRFLRVSLRANAAFSTLSGLSMLFASAPLADLLGVAPAALVTTTGLNLLGFAVLLLWLASRDEIRVALARAVVIADLAWVAATAVLVPLGVFSEAGNWVVIVVADAVLALAIFQWIGIRRMHRRSGPIPV